MYILYAIIAFASFAIDQITKNIAVSALKGKASIHIIGDFFRLTYVENRGAAFGILQNQWWFFIIATTILTLLLIYMIWFSKRLTKHAKLSLSLVLGGALGNFLDRLRFGYVIDFFDVRFGSLYDFPVFNVADSCLVIGIGIIILLIIFNKFDTNDDVNTQV